MNRELRVLMLEDTPTDAELAEHELRKAGIAFTALRVETQDAFVRAFVHLGSYDGRRPFYPWISTIAVGEIPAF